MKPTEIQERHMYGNPYIRIYGENFGEIRMYSYGFLKVFGCMLYFFRRL